MKQSVWVMPVLVIGGSCFFAQALDPRLGFWIVPVHLFARCVRHLERHDFKVALLKALDNLADEPFAHAVGLDEHERFLFFWMLHCVPKNSLRRSKKQKLLLVDVAFLILDFVITFLMFKVWFWLVTNRTLLTILLVITLLGLMKQVWKHVGELSDHWQL